MAKFPDGSGERPEAKLQALTVYCLLFLKRIPMDEKDKYGLIAGNGSFPFMVLQSARQQNIDVVIAAIKEETSPDIESCGYPVHWLGLGELGKLIKVFRNSGVRKAIMAGQVKHAQIFGSSFPDLTMIRMLAGLRQKNTDSLIGGVARVLEESGITLVDSTVLLKPHMIPKAPLHEGDLRARKNLTWNTAVRLPNR